MTRRYDCHVCLDSGTERTPNGLEPEEWPETGRPCWICAEPHPRHTGHVAACLYCGRISTEASYRTGDALCPPCGRMERGEDDRSRRWDRDDEWARTLGLTEAI